MDKYMILDKVVEAAPYLWACLFMHVLILVLYVCSILFKESCQFLGDAFAILSPDGTETIRKDDEHKRKLKEKGNRFCIAVTTFSIIQALRLLGIACLFLSI